MAISAADATARSRAAFGLAPSLGGGVSAPVGGIVQAPPMRGIYGWYDPRMQGVPAETPLTVIRDCSGMGHDLPLVGPSAGLMQKYVLQPVPHANEGTDGSRYGSFRHGFVGVAPNWNNDTFYVADIAGGVQPAAWTMVFTGIRNFYHNSNCCYSIGQNLADNYSTLTWASVTGGRACGSFGGQPVSSTVLLSGRAYTFAVIVDSVAGYVTLRVNGDADSTTVPFSTTNLNNNASLNRLESCRGNAWGANGSMLFYTVALTTDEVRQAEGYIAHVHNLW